MFKASFIILIVALLSLSLIYVSRPVPEPGEHPRGILGEHQRQHAGVADQLPGGLNEVAVQHAHDHPPAHEHATAGTA